MKTGRGALGTTPNDSGSLKHDNRDPTLSVPPKTSPRAQNMKMGPHALGTSKMNQGAQNMKTRPGALGTVENDSGSSKHENGT
jgi:hypothetical protein